MPQVHRAVVLGLIGSIFGWPDRKGASDCADEVILARKGEKSRRRATSLRSKTTKAGTHVGGVRESRAELEKKLEARTRELAEDAPTLVGIDHGFLYVEKGAL